MSCQKCERKCDLFLCTQCVAELQGMLTALAGELLPSGDRAPGWLTHLQEAALGQTRFGELVRRSRGEVPMRLNLKAAELYDYARSILSEWVRDLCETRGVTWRPLKAAEAGFIGPLLPDQRRLPADHRATPIETAEWLSANVSALASDQGAGVAYREISELVQDIQRLVDRPRSYRFVGPCPAELDGDHDKNCTKVHPHPCGVAMMAKREASETCCPACKTPHVIADVMAQLVDDLGEWHFTQFELLHTVLPALAQPVAARTFRSWVHKRRLIPVGYRRSDGVFSLTWTSPEDKPAYRLADVRRLRDEKPQTKVTGAAANTSGKVRARLS